MAHKLTAKVVGRPSVYTEAVAAEILGRMSRGETLTSICREPGMPVISTVSLWAIDDKPKGFSERYARARQMQADAIAEDAVDIADGDPAADAAKTRLKVDTRKWLASKINPAKFGERSRVDTTAVNVDLEKCSVDQLRRIAAGEPIAVVLAGK